MAIDWTPPPPPGRDALEGERVRLEPFAAAHRDRLFDALHEDGDPALWDFLPYGPFARPAWNEWFAAAAASGDPHFRALLVDGEPLGQASYLRITPAHGTIEIGHIALGPRLQRTAAATEAIHLLSSHAFDLGYRRLEWKCNALNQRSRRAAQRFGFTFEGVFRQHMVVKGRNRDTAWFSITDAEWPAIRAANEAWLDPANFDADGRQRRPLRPTRERASCS